MNRMPSPGKKSLTNSDLISTGITCEIENFRKDLIADKLNIQFLLLQRPNFINGITFFVLDWTIIFLSFSIALIYPIFLPICLIIAGSTQRALSNLIHDSSHWNLTRKKNINDIATDIFAGFSLISPVKNYRASHLLHHWHLGNPMLDPDLKMHLRYKYNDFKTPYAKWYRNVLYLIFNINSWKDSSLGMWNEINIKQKLACISWWVVFIIFFSQFSIKYTFYFILFWQLARATSYHIVRIIAEFLDHSGLPTGSITKNSRLIESPSWLLKKIIHPHFDNFHALHHFAPPIPHYNLSAAHNLIQSQPICYKNVKKNDGYFSGNNAAIRDLVGIT